MSRLEPVGSSRGIIVLGVPRSGTTLLRRLIDAHPAVCCPSGTYVFTACGRFLRQATTPDDLRVGVLTGLELAGTPEARTLEAVRGMAFAMHEEIAARHGKKRWATKTPFDTFYIDEIEKLCGDAVQYVCIVRHAVDVACSLQEFCQATGRYLPEIHPYIQRHPAPLEAFAHLWVDLSTRMHALAGARPASVHLIRYEDLVADPIRTMDRLGEFIGEPWSAELVSSALDRESRPGLGDWRAHERKTIDGSSVGRWKKLSPATVATLAAIVNPTLELLGYEPLPTRTADAGDGARRRYQLGMLFASAKGRDAR